MLRKRQQFRNPLLAFRLLVAIVLAWFILSTTLHVRFNSSYPGFVEDVSRQETSDIF